MQKPTKSLVLEFDKAKTVAQLSKQILDLTEYFQRYEVSQQQLVGCWEKIQPFTVGQLRPEAFDWISVCLQYHYDECDLLRLDFYKVIQNGSPDTIIGRLKLLQALTKDGRDFRHLEHEIGLLLANWISSIVDMDKKAEILRFIVKVVKYSFLYLNEPILTRMLNETTILSKSHPHLNVCLEFLEALCRFGFIPQQSLYNFTMQLSRGVNDLALSEQSIAVLDITLDSHMAGLTMKNFLMILNSQQESDCINGAISILLKIILEEDGTVFSQSLFVNGLATSTSIRDLSVCGSVMSAVAKLVTLADFDYDGAVVILSKAVWILEDSIELDLVKIVVERVIQIVNLIFLRFEELSFKSRTEFLTTVVHFSTVLDNEKILKMIDSIEYYYWYSPERFWSFINLMIVKVYRSSVEAIDIRKKIVTLVFDQINTQPLDSVNIEGFTQSVRLLFQTFEIETSTEMILYVLSNVFKDIQRFDDILVENMLEFLLRIVCNCRLVSVTVDNYLWQLTSKVAVQTIPSLTDDVVTARPFDLSFSSVVVEKLAEFYELLISVSRLKLAGELYTRLCFMASWFNFLDQNVRMKLIELIASLPVEKVLQATIDENAYEPYVLTSISIMLNDPSSSMLIYSLDTLRSVLTKNLSISSAKSIPLLAETVLNAITKENGLQHLTDVQGMTKRIDSYLALYCVEMSLFQFKSVLSKSILDGFVSSLLYGLGRWPTIARHCIQGLSLALYEIPASMTRYLPAILMKISQVTSSNLAQANLEFISTIAFLPELHTNLTFNDYKRIFGIALTYLRESEAKNAQVLTLSYFATQLWFLTIKVAERKNYVPMIVSTMLANTGGNAENALDESVELVLDMMVQHTFIDCSPKITNKESNPTKSKTWCLGNSLVTINVQSEGKLNVIIRRAAGVTMFESKLLNETNKFSIYYKNEELMKSLMAQVGFSGGPRSRSASVDSVVQPSEQVEKVTFTNPEVRLRSNSLSDVPAEEEFKLAEEEVAFPGFLLLQFQSYPSLESSKNPIPLPEDDSSFTRALSVLDRTPSIDLHKVGVVYVSQSQTTETEILSNTFGSNPYCRFLAAIGRKFPLLNAQDIYTGGLDTSSEALDGNFAYYSIIDQRLCQMIFHVTTLMPNWPHDPQRTFKKRHIGNDAVMIVWNDSGKPFNFDTIPSQFNLIQIIIEPQSETLYETSTFLVTVVIRSDIGRLAPLPILLSGASLGQYVRQLAIFCCSIAQMSTGNTTSNAKERLRQIKRLCSRLPKTEPSTSNLDFTPHYA